MIFRQKPFTVQNGILKFVATNSITRRWDIFIPTTNPHLSNLILSCRNKPYGSEAGPLDSSRKKGFN